MTTRKLNAASTPVLALISNIDPFALPAKRDRPPPAPRQYDSQLQAEIAEHNAAVDLRKAEKKARKTNIKSTTRS